MAARSIRLGFLVALALADVTGVRAQATPPPLTFPSEVELISIDAVAVDGKGQPVTGLTKDDFVVEEDGKPQEIVTFESVSVPVEAEAGAGARPAEPPAVTTNIETRRAGRVFALIADDLRLPAEQSKHLRAAMARFIETSLSPGDTVLLGTSSGEAGWTARIPEGRQDLLRVLDRLKGRFTDPSNSEHITEYEALAITQLAREPLIPGDVFERVVTRVWDMNLCGHKEPDDIRPCLPYVKQRAVTLDALRRQRVARTLAAMGRALGALPRTPGRAALVLFSPGFLNDGEGREVAALALQARAAVYFVDVRGLETGIISAAEKPDGGSIANPGDFTRKQFEQIALASSGAEGLAEETGGFSLRNTNDLAGAAERIAAESRTFYLLGITPPPGKKADAWRKLRVKVRRDGVTVRARRGYSVEAAGSHASARTPIPVRLASYVLAPAADVTLVVAVAEVDTTGLASDLQMRLEAQPRDGGTVQVHDVSLQGAVTGGAWRSARLSLALPAGVHNVRVFLRDPATERTGAVEQRVVVPEPSDFRLSTPVLTDTIAPTGPLPLARDVLASRSDRPLFVSFEVFGATPEAGTGERRVATEFDLKDAAARSIAAAPATLLAPSPEGRWQQLIALPALPNGHYDLTITARDRVAGSERVEHRAFKIAGGAEPPKAPAAEAAAPADTELATLLDRAGQYVRAYENDFSNVVAEEDCRQTVRGNLPSMNALRLLKSATFFVTVPGVLPWTTFRDVWEVDGNRIRNREQRLSRLFQDSPGDAVARARAILEESNRYNLGPRRTVNAPTLALLFLLPENQRRFDFEIKGRERVQQTMTVTVAFRERLRPALVAGDSAEGSPAAGRMWIDPERGVVVKTDVTYDKSQARIITEYRPEPRLGLWVPDRMKESYSWPPTAPTEALTRYSEYRRFGVSTEESFDAAPESAPAPKQ